MWVCGITLTTMCRAEMPRRDSRPSSLQAGPKAQVVPDALGSSRPLSLERLWCVLFPVSESGVAVLQVLKKYKLTSPSIDQLRSHYFQHFVEELPFEQYLSLYHSWAASHSRSPSAAGSHTPVTPTSPNRMTCTDTNDRIPAGDTVPPPVFERCLRQRFLHGRVSHVFVISSVCVCCMRQNTGTFCFSLS